VIVAAELRYGGYSYRERADRYLRDFSTGETDQIRAASSRVKYSALREQLLRSAFQQAELLVARNPASPR
jgi:nucleoid DNA-binding protein